MTETTERPARAGEFCTCGRPAAVVFHSEQWGDTGYCGVSDSGAGPCPWCDAEGGHVGRCPAYTLTGARQ